MSLFVVDASVAIKWFVPEILSPEAMAFRKSGHDFHAPNFFDVEITNIAWKKLQRGELTRQDADDIVQQLAILPVARHSETQLLAPALDLADKTQRTVYDCLYLALAQQIGGVMITADQKLANALAATPLAACIQYLGAMP
ncbi:MAG: type II toxin-antitoxin system VapC family toxin [Pirellulaceae bacterium]